jgi:hypothetical protein
MTPALIERTESEIVRGILTPHKEGTYSLIYSPILFMKIVLSDHGWNYPQETAVGHFRQSYIPPPFLLSGGPFRSFFAKEFWILWKLWHATTAITPDEYRRRRRGEGGN